MTSLLVLAFESVTKDAFRADDVHYYKCDLSDSTEIEAVAKKIQSEVSPSSPASRDYHLMGRDRWAILRYSSTMPASFKGNYYSI